MLIFIQLMQIRMSKGINVTGSEGSQLVPLVEFLMLQKEYACMKYTITQHATRNTQHATRNTQHAT